MKNLRVAVVPTETGYNEINQKSTVDDILKCEETALMPIADYFQYQNDNFLPEHWSFLIDISANKNITGVDAYEAHIAEEKIKIKVAFGEALVSWVESGNPEDDFDGSCVDGEVQQFEFNTQSEANAFVLGLSQMLDWKEYSIIN